MSDKIYQTEGASEVGASMKPMSQGYFLISAEDVHIGENKSLAEYIAEGGGSGGGDVVVDGNCAYRYLETELGIENTIGALRTELRDAGVSIHDRCLVHCVSWSFPDVIIRLSDSFANGLITVSELYFPTNPINYTGTITITTTIGTIIEQIESPFNTDAQTIAGAINEINANRKTSDTKIGEIETDVAELNEKFDQIGSLASGLISTDIFPANLFEENTPEEHYTISVPNLQTLIKGMRLTIIPHKTNTRSPKLKIVDVSSEKPIYRRASTKSGNFISVEANVLTEGTPITLMYAGSYWFLESMPYVSVSGSGGSGLPSYSTSDNGKFLRIVDGQPAWVLITNAEEASF